VLKTFRSSFGSLKNEKIGWNVVQLICICGVCDSNLSPDIGYPEWGFSVIFLSPFRKWSNHSTLHCLSYWQHRQFNHWDRQRSSTALMYLSLMAMNVFAICWAPFTPYSRIFKWTSCAMWKSLALCVQVIMYLVRAERCWRGVRRTLP
jgi:hypothetical protein